MSGRRSYLPGSGTRTNFVRATATYVFFIGMLGLLTLHASVSVVQATYKAVFLQVSNTAAPKEPSPVITASKVAYDFNEMFQSEAFWRKRASRRPSGRSRGAKHDFSSRNRLGRDPDDFGPFGIFSSWDDDHEEEDRADGASAYRTMCVRLCDGFYWPVSFNASASRLSVDASACQSSCSSPARLFFYRNPGQDIKDMKDLSGRPYANLPSAFLYRTTYKPDCKCRPNAWEKASLDRHRRYELADLKRRKKSVFMISRIASLTETLYGKAAARKVLLSDHRTRTALARRFVAPLPVHRPAGRVQHPLLPQLKKPDLAIAALQRRQSPRIPLPFIKPRDELVVFQDLPAPIRSTRSRASVLAASERRPHRALAAAPRMSLGRAPTRSGMTRSDRPVRPMSRMRSWRAAVFSQD